MSDIGLFNDIRTAQEVHDNAFTALTNVGGVQGLVNNWQVDGNSVAGHAVVDARGGPQLDLIGYSAPTLEALNGVSSVHLGAGRATAQGLYLDHCDGLAGGTNLTVWSMGAGLVQGSPNVITTGIGGYTAFG